MKFTAHIHILPLKELLDPQGKAVNESLHSLNMHAIHDVRIGKYITLDIESDSRETAHQLATDACEKLLHNRVMENYSISIE